MEGKNTINLNTSSPQKHPRDGRFPKKLGLWRFYCYVTKKETRRWDIKTGYNSIGGWNLQNIWGRSTPRLQAFKSLCQKPWIVQRRRSKWLLDSALVQLIKQIIGDRAMDIHLSVGCKFTLSREWGRIWVVIDDLEVRPDREIIRSMSFPNATI